MLDASWKDFPQVNSLCFAAYSEVVEQIDSSDGSTISHTEILHAQSAWPEDQAIRPSLRTKPLDPI